MKPLIHSFILSLAVATLGAGFAFAQQPSAFATMVGNKGEALGGIAVKQATGGVLLSIDLKDLPPGPHGFHIHHTGDCSDHDHFQKAGGHVKEEGDQHGLLNPQGPEAGDLPNLIVHTDGTVKAEIYAPDLEISGDSAGALIDADGSAFMIHANPDDHITQPIGNAGDRIACGAIKVAE